MRNFETFVTTAIIFLVIVLIVYSFSKFKKHSEKKLAKRMLGGVNVIKLVLYKILISDFSKKYKDEKFYKPLAGAVINEIFGKHTKGSKEMFDNKKELVISEIKNLGINHPRLKRPITDALRVYVIANYALGSEMIADIEYINNLFNKAMKRGIFIKEGEAPKYDSFLDMATELGLEYGFLSDKREKLEKRIEESDTKDVLVNFINYCKAYLSECCHLTKKQAELLILDPELGMEIDKAKRKWLKEDLGWKNLNSGIDPDIFLVPKLFDAPQMKRINNLLDKYANEYSNRKSKIIDYLESIGFLSSRKSKKLKKNN